jgi:hypothetical protein
VRRTSDNNLLSKLNPLTSECCQCSREDEYFDVGRARRQKVSERVKRRSETDSFGSTEDVEDFREGRFPDGESDLLNELRFSRCGQEKREKTETH